jgi:hypothetical protein
VKVNEMNSTDLVVSGIKGQIVSIQVNLAAKQAIFGVALVGLDGTPRGETRIAIMPTAQPATDTQEAIPSFDEFMSENAEAQQAFGAMQTFILSFLGDFSKEIDLPPAA